MGVREFIVNIVLTFSEIVRDREGSIGIERDRQGLKSLSFWGRSLILLWPTSACHAGGAGFWSVSPSWQVSFGLVLDPWTIFNFVSSNERLMRPVSRIPLTIFPCLFWPHSTVSKSKSHGLDKGLSL